MAWWLEHSTVACSCNLVNLEVGTWILKNLEKTMNKFHLQYINICQKITVGLNLWSHRIRLLGWCAPYINTNVHLRNKLIDIKKKQDVLFYCMFIKGTFFSISVFGILNMTSRKPHTTDAEIEQNWASWENNHKIFMTDADNVSTTLKSKCPFFLLASHL